MSENGEPVAPPPRTVWACSRIPRRSTGPFRRATRASTACSSSASPRPASTAGRSARRGRRRRANCRFFDSAAGGRAGAASAPACAAGPSWRPGSAPVDDAQRIAHADRRSASRTGTLDDDARARSAGRAQFELSSRQLRRIVQQGARRLADPARCRRAACCSPSSCSPRRRCRSPRSRSPAASRACAASTTPSAAATACRRRGCASARRTDGAERPRRDDLDAAALVPAALRLGGRARVPARPRSSRASSG